MNLEEAFKDIKDIKLIRNEDSIFKAYNRINEIKEEALRKKSAAKKSKNVQKPSVVDTNVHKTYSNPPEEVADDDEIDLEIKPFDDLDDATLI